EAMRQLADEAMEFIFILDSELNLKYVNEFGARFLGKNPVDIVGTSLRTVFPPDAVDFQLNAVRKVFESGESLLVEDSASFASGDIYLETRLIPMKREGAVFSVLGVSRNITERKQMESALRESEERYRAFIHAVPYGIQITDAEGKITFSNPAHHRMLGYLEGELPGKHIWDFIDDVQERESLRAYYKTIISSQPVPSPAFQSNVTKDGRRINVRVDWDYMRNQDNEVTGICSVVSDITELQRAEDALRGSEERLRLLTDSLPVLISYIDTEQRLRFVNKHFEMWGHRSVLIGRKV
ncbi:MAG: PAS domain S-box protein, partial [candidate division Zixibacteria bacterium]|nr:PAS domain S-box protein [candidate division Zixibacteria bacterium]NIX55266.1 PAS domain S-box protein [candidate division Zixibacteria bacterium]